MIIECHEPCDACYNCLFNCHWDSERQCMVREEDCCDNCIHIDRTPIIYEVGVYCLCVRREIEIPIEFLTKKFCDEWEGRE